jgi:hypothetical protein
MPAVVRVLVALDPFMYGEALAFSLRKRRPRAEVTLLASSEEHLLAAELERARPHLVVANRVPPAATKARSFFWVEVDALRGPTSLDAEISADGYSGSVADVRVEHVLAALDRAEEELLLAGGESAGEEETVGGATS